MKTQLTPVDLTTLEIAAFGVALFGIMHARAGEAILEERTIKQHANAARQYAKAFVAGATEIYTKVGV